MDNEALRLIERLGAALLAEHECYADRGVVCAECNLCKEAREFLAAQPKIGEDYCQICGNILDGYVPPPPTEPPIEISEDEWDTITDRFKLACCEQSCGCGGYETLKKLGPNGSIAARRGVTPCNPNPSPTKEKP